MLTIWKTKKVGYEPERENVPEKNQNIGKNILKKLPKKEMYIFLKRKLANNRKCRKKEERIIKHKTLYQKNRQTNQKQKTYQKMLWGGWEEQQSSTSQNHLINLFKMYSKIKNAYLFWFYFKLEKFIQTLKFYNNSCGLWTFSDCHVCYVSYL